MIDERHLRAAEVKGLIYAARSELLDIFVNVAFDNVDQTPEKLKGVYGLLNEITTKCKKENNTEEDEG